MLRRQQTILIWLHFRLQSLPNSQIQFSPARRCFSFFGSEISALLARFLTCISFALYLSRLHQDAPPLRESPLNSKLSQGSGDAARHCKTERGFRASPSRDPPSPSSLVSPSYVLHSVYITYFTNQPEILHENPRGRRRATHWIACRGEDNMQTKCTTALNPSMWPSVKKLE